MTRQEYVKLVEKWRKTQLTEMGGSMKRLQAIYDNSIKNMISLIENAEEPASTLILVALNEELNALQSNYAKMLDLSLYDLAQKSADRQLEIETLLDKLPDNRLTPNRDKSYIIENHEFSVRFGRLASDAVDRSYARVWGDGYRLSERLYALDEFTRGVVSDTIVEGVAQQLSAKALADNIQKIMGEAGTDCPRYRAERIARTEINEAFRSAHILACKNEDGTLKDYISGIRWVLSFSHPKPDICDVFASQDKFGLGKGIYEVDAVPVSHPNCLCNQLTELKDYPTTDLRALKPEPELVPETEIARYGQQ